MRAALRRSSKHLFLIAIMNQKRARKKNPAKATYPYFSYNNAKALLGHLTKPGTLNSRSPLLHYAAFFSFSVQAKMFDSFGVMLGHTSGFFKISCWYKNICAISWTNPKGVLRWLHANLWKLFCWWCSWFKLWIFCYIFDCGTCWFIFKNKLFLWLLYSLLNAVWMNSLDVQLLEVSRNARYESNPFLLLSPQTVC